MVTCRLSADIKEDRRIEVVLPPETPLGLVALTVTVEALNEPPPPHIFRQADWSAMYAEDWGEDLVAVEVEDSADRQA